MEHILEIAGTVVGLIYLWQEYHASIHLWITSIIMPAIYLFVYYDAGLYADFGINIYYLVIAVYGWLAWKYGFSFFGENKNNSELEISHTPHGSMFRLTAAALIIWVFIAWILIKFTDSNVPLSDAFTTALSIVGMYMLARKYIEQWWVWLVADVASGALYIYKGLYFTAVLYGIYAVISIFGYKKWKSMMQERQKQFPKYEYE